MAITKIQSESLNLADTYDFTGTVTGAGGVNTPSFKATLSSSQTGITSGAWTKVLFNTEEYDIGSVYDNSTNYRFTPGETGKFYIFFTVRLSTVGPIVEKKPFLLAAYLYKNGSRDLNFGSQIQDSDGGVNNFDTTHLNCSGIVNVTSASDYFEIYGKSQNELGAGDGIIDNRSMFGAYKIIT